MMEGELERTVRVWGNTYTVRVHQKSKSVWIAVGDYRGERIEGKGTSLTSAVADWSRTATYRGNL
jgi:hypothetical protein